jgi:hypothetical protein
MGPRHNRCGAQGAIVPRLAAEAEVAITIPTSAALLDAWAAGASSAPIDQAPSLLSALGVLAPDMSIGSLIVGQCDAALYRLRRELFGDQVEVIATCAQCGSEADVEFSISEIEPLLPEPAQTESTLATHGLWVRYRLARNEDLSAAGASGCDPLAELMRRCIISAVDGDGEPVSVADLPNEIGEALVDSMAAADPAASVEFALDCSTCEATWIDEVDIRAILWSDLTDWVGRILTDVHSLASEYGWSESEIIALPTWRRRWYTEAVGR